MMLERLIYLIAGLPLFWLSTTLHGMAQAGIAYALGDQQISRRWRFFFDPRLHLDILGSVLFGLTWLTGLTFTWNGLYPVGVGWSRPPDYRPGAFRRPQTGILLVALAGPFTYVVQAAGWHTLAQALEGWNSEVAFIARLAASTNLVLATFHLVPLPPLDGATILANLLSRRGAIAVESLHPGLTFLLLWISLSLPPVAAAVLGPAQWLANWLSHLI